jgi:hypothetical protein
VIGLFERRGRVATDDLHSHFKLGAAGQTPGSHLHFADDTLLFFRADEDEAVRVRHVIDLYSNATG